MSRVIGIDLGCRESCVAAIVNGRPQLITDTHGLSSFPSCVFIDPDGRIWAGDEEMKRATDAPERLLEETSKGSWAALNKPINCCTRF